MKIQFVRSGGFAGLRSECRLDVDELPADERRQVEILVEQARFFALPAECRSPHPDAFLYTIVIESHGTQHEVRADDRGAPDDLRPLIDFLMRMARR